jgi:hypothetical protein
MKIYSFRSGMASPDAGRVPVLWRLSTRAAPESRSSSKPGSLKCSSTRRPARLPIVSSSTSEGSDSPLPHPSVEPTTCFSLPAESAFSIFAFCWCSFVVVQCPQEDLNLHAFASTRPRTVSLCDAMKQSVRDIRAADWLRVPCAAVMRRSVKVHTDRVRRWVTEWNMRLRHDR